MEENIIMKKIGIGIILVISLLISMQLQVIAPPSRHCKGLEIYFYKNPDEAFTALKAGEIDIMQWYLNEQQYEDAVTHPDLLLASYAENGMFEFDINNNYTIEWYPGVRSLTNEITFRQAIAHMVDKDWIIDDVLEGWGQRIDAHVTAPQTVYANQSVIGENYPYKYNLTRAAELLNVYFADTDEDGTRNYPVGWPGRESGPNLDTIRFFIRSDHYHRKTVGHALADNMEASGIPVNIIYPYPWWPWDSTNYHIYTGGWSLGRLPTYLYGLFHSSNWGPDDSNYVTGMNESNLPNYPDLDEILEDVYFATSIEGFKNAVKKATGLLIEYCVNIPLWSYVSYCAYSKSLAGVINMDGYGLENTYTFLDAYKVDDPATPEDESQEPIRMGTIHAPNKLNILYSAWYYDYAVLDRIFDSLLSVNPYDLSADQPWIAQDWKTSTWTDPYDDETKTKVTYWIRKDVWWHAPVTGEATRQFTAHDVEFTIWYIYAFTNCVPWYSFRDVHHTKIVDDFTIEVYFDVESIWLWTARYSPTGPLLPKDEYTSLLCGAGSASFYSDGANCTASRRLIFTWDEVVQVVDADLDGAPLVEGVDFEILTTGAPGYHHNRIHLLTNLTEGTVTINYYKPTVDPQGYYLGGLGWAQTFYSLGPYYPMSITSGVGGSAIFNCVSSYFLETPPLGDIDWKWTWTGTTRPRSGYYQINLFDAVLLLKAYGSLGNGEPITNWFPGADLNPNDPGRISLYDAVTVISKYGTKWGTPPP